MRIAIVISATTVVPLIFPLSPSSPLGISILTTVAEDELIFENIVKVAV